MAYSGKLSSVRQVVESAYMDAGLEKIDYPSAIETCVNLMGIIGVPDLYVEKTTNNNELPVIEVYNYRAKLPDDMINLIDMRKVIIGSDNKILSYSEMIESTDIYHMTQSESSTSGTSYYPPVASHPDMELNEYDELESNDGIIIGSPVISGAGLPYTYKVQGNHVFTNFKDGFIESVYTGYPLDNEGFPMIPDDEKFKNALKYEIIYKLDWKSWRANPASPGLKALVNDSEQRRDWYVGAARNKARIPNIGQMESLKNQWLRSIPKIRSHKNGFKTNNIGEVRYN